MGVYSTGNVHMDKAISGGNSNKNVGNITENQAKASKRTRKAAKKVKKKKV